MTGGVDLVSDCEERVHTKPPPVNSKLAARNLAKCHATGQMRRVRGSGAVPELERHPNAEGCHSVAHRLA